MRGERSARVFADGIGIVGSSACAIHCLMAPILLVSGTALPVSVVEDETFHQMLVWAIVPASLLAFSIGCWRHRDLQVLLLGALGLCGLALSVAIPHESIGESGERILTLASAATLVVGHVRNFRRCSERGCEPTDGLS